MQEVRVVSQIGGMQSFKFYLNSKTSSACNLSMTTATWHQDIRVLFDQIHLRVLKCQKIQPDVGHDVSESLSHGW